MAGRPREVVFINATVVKRGFSSSREYPFLKFIYEHEEQLAKSHGCAFNPVIKVKRGQANLSSDRRTTHARRGSSLWIQRSLKNKEAGMLLARQQARQARKNARLEA